MRARAWSFRRRKVPGRSEYRVTKRGHAVNLNGSVDGTNTKMIPTRSKTNARRFGVDDASFSKILDQMQIVLAINECQRVIGPKAHESDVLTRYWVLVAQIEACFARHVVAVNNASQSAPVINSVRRLAYTGPAI